MQVGTAPCFLAAGQEGRRGRTKPGQSTALVARDTDLGLDFGHTVNQDIPGTLGRENCVYKMAFFLFLWEKKSSGVRGRFTIALFGFQTRHAA